jgi:hypothetical protein
MKLVIETYGYKYSIETPKEDIDMEEMYDLVQQLILAAGFHPDNVKEYFE